jgi:hypothetical protein
MAAPPPSLSALVQRGMALFRALDVAGSLAALDAAHAAHPAARAQLWQRGLSLYYAGRYAEGAAQFRLDTQHNPADAEEALWACLCEARALPGGLAQAQAGMLRVGEDPRPVLRLVLRVYRGEAGAEALAGAARAAGASAHDAFYALLYQGLLLEAQGRAAASGECIAQALATPYAASSTDYMVSVARVHAQQRGLQLAAAAAAHAV